MNDRYLDLSRSGWGKSLMTALGLPAPPELKRGEGSWAERPLDQVSVTVGCTSHGRNVKPVLEALGRMGANLRVLPQHPGLALIKAASQQLGLTIAGNPVAGEGPASQVLVFDASGLQRPEQLREVYDFFQPQAAQMPLNGRVVLLVPAPAAAPNANAAASAYALNGFVRSFAKEAGRKGTTVNLLELAPGAESRVEGPLRFFLSPHSAFVTGQTLVLTASDAPSAPWVQSLGGKVAVVTGAARGIGAAIVQVLAREGAKIVGIDRPQEEAALAETLSKVGGLGLALDVTAADAPEKITQQCRDKFGGVDVVVHNAGITRDKLLRNMRAEHWDQVLEVNLASILRINDQLIPKGLKPGARLVCISSIGGIAGNAGQTNYGATKSGVIGYTQALAAEMAERGGAINAVAPGFIETQMTAMMPIGHREVGRRLNSLSQGGLPVDIAETVAFLASPYAAAVNGRTLRVCGQNWVGA